MRSYLCAAEWTGGTSRITYQETMIVDSTKTALDVIQMLIEVEPTWRANQSVPSNYWCCKLLVNEV